jgi:hypothetical protein
MQGKIFEGRAYGEYANRRLRAFLVRRAVVHQV